MAKIRQDKDGWDPLSVPLRRAENGTRGLDSLGSDGSKGSRADTKGTALDSFLC